ncbi:MULTISPECIES: alpha/beta hydrolase [unclassified Sphingomonas]|jgi:hypothetical protein|uniref:alpha/beta hydrolase n=1 Tax=unclassified Sphingomonas TaxID=196159 RepID=UPI00082D41A4|nr:MULTISPECIES: alpha/beta hydrolase-fold protein [unclassified Sphingomonas]
MMRRRAALGALLAAAGCARVRPLTAAAPRLDEWTLDAPGIGPLRVSIWRPDATGADAPPRGVLYMHDGQNLFDPAVSGYGKVWHVDRAAARLAAAGTIDPPIIVGVWNPGDARFRTYLPRAAYDRLAPDVRADLGVRIGDGPVRSDAYLAFMADVLKPAVDRAYRTRPGVADTRVMGSSMGGLISLYALVERPDIFGAAGCLSTHWPMFIPPDDRAAAPHADAVTAAWTGYLRDRLGKPVGRRIWFDHGTATLDRLYAPYQAAVDALLPALGWRPARDFASRTYSGAPHEENAWAARVADPLAWLFAVA